jgi:hypothetical protein
MSYWRPAIRERRGSIGASGSESGQKVPELMRISSTGIARGQALSQPALVTTATCSSVTVTQKSLETQLTPGNG